MCSGDGLQLIIQREFEAKMELRHMALPPFFVSVYGIDSWRSDLPLPRLRGTGNVSKDTAPGSTKLCQELKCCRILLPIKKVFIQSCQKTCCKQELNFIVVLG